MICHRIDYANEKFQVHLRLYILFLIVKHSLDSLVYQKKFVTLHF